MTQKEIESQLKEVATEGAITMSLTEISRAVKDTNLNRVRKKYLLGLPRLGSGYLIRDVARRLYENANY